MKNYYTILGVMPTDSIDKIKSPYKSLAKKYHPDLNSDPSAQAIFQEINEAHAILSDPNQKARYDILLFQLIHNQRSSSSNSTTFTAPKYKTKRTKATNHEPEVEISKFDKIKLGAGVIFSLYVIYIIFVNIFYFGFSTPKNEITYEQPYFLRLEYRNYHEISPSLMLARPVQGLSLKNNWIKEVPPSIKNLQKLEYLNLKNNVIDSLPDEIGSLQNLVWLDLSSNNFLYVPYPIYKLKKLKVLYLRDNQLTFIPNDILNLAELKHLIITGNPIPPHEIQKLKQKLPQVEIDF